jgi:two-component system sensor histidine kinase DegS
LADPERLDRLIAAEQDERRRIALFLHDGPVQHLAGIALMLDAALQSMVEGKIEDARGVMASALSRQRQIIRELRDLSFALEPVVLRDQGFWPALEALASQIGTTHELRVDLDVVEAERIGESAQIALYTIIRELLDQSIRRGSLSRISVSLTRQPDGSLLTVVADDAEPERRRRSFDAIEERVHQIHGEIELVASDTGTEVHVTMPAFAAQR